jgi:CubicO group peptidase (beta-lactamase class C family)
MEDLPLRHDTHVCGVPGSSRPSLRAFSRSLARAALILVAGACSARGQVAGPLVLPLPTVPAEELEARRLPVRRIQDTVALVLNRAMRDSAFPGGVAIVGTHSGILAHHAVGKLSWGNSPAPDERTLWDLASLTKVIALTSAVMHLSQQGKLDVEAPVQRYLPEWRGPMKDQVRIKDLLTHSSGLPSWRPLYKETETRAEALRLVISTPLEAAPGSRMVYSDLGAILLGQIVERVSGTSLEQYAARNIFEPLGMRETMFHPPPKFLPRIAPTEYDPWRQRLVRGEVHDENAYRLGGASSHAGLFSTAVDLTRIARMYLNGGELDGVRVLDSATIARFTRAENRQLSHRALGWETANGANSGGRLMSDRAFGHTGFTGTSIWIDPGHDLFVILLTNRVHPTRENRKISGVRIALADAVSSLVQ